MEAKVRKEEKKKLLIYAHYYAPDVASTGQILKELAEGMLDVFDITVICVVPSYGGKIDPEYRRNRFYYEEINGVHVIRVRVPEFDKTNKLSRIRNIAAYAVRAALATFQVKNVDYVFSISQPPILGGLLGVWGKLTRRARFIYNIQDFNPEQVIAVNYTRNPLILKTAMALDKFSCRRADKVIVVGRDMVDTLKRRFQQNKLPRYAFINNWVDEKELYPLPADDPQVTAFRRKYGLENKYVIMYSGNLGLYYDLENLIRVIKEFRKGRTMDGRIENGPLTADGREVVFAFVGAGGSRKHEAETGKIQGKALHRQCDFHPLPEKRGADLQPERGGRALVRQREGDQGRIGPFQAVRLPGSAEAGDRRDGAGSGSQADHGRDRLRLCMRPRRL